MTMYHGAQYYAVYSRDVGTFGGRAKRATLKIYSASCANIPLKTLDNAEDISEFKSKWIMADGNRPKRDTIMSEFITRKPIRL